MTDLREQIAKSVYAGMQWACANNCGDNAPEWAEGGNSFAQDEARKQADAIIELLKGEVPTDAVEALSSYQQADMDGIIVTVSRQAIEECLPVLRAIAALGVK